MHERSMDAALIERAREAIGRAQAAIAEADVLRATARLLRDPASMARRCAWCGRLALGRTWKPADQVPEELRTRFEDRATHGICATCLRRLEREGQSHRLDARP